MKVLIIEDNNEIIESVAQILSLRWPEANLISTTLGESGVELAKKEMPDLIILDLGLPDIDGFQVLRKIRSFTGVPVVILTVREEEINKVKGLEMGADDYIVKPFSVGEFLARLKAALRRSQLPISTVATATDQPFIRRYLRIDFQSHEVSIGGKVMKLSPSEYDLLYLLVTNEGQVMPKKALLEKVWGKDQTNTEYVDVYIKSLRDMLAKEPGEPIRILEENGGYKLVSS